MSFSTAGSSPPNNPSGQQRTQRRPTQSTTRTRRSESQPSSSRRASPTTSDPASEQWVSGDAARQTTSGEMEREAGERGRDRSSPSVSSSQGDMADNEGEAGPSQPSQMAQPITSPPKKKRTRTLTTPHQSAVLHALLAQSRFPTTAMREEVGRAIGLSARKVQIWFQNQRQKARRPRGQQSAPLTRPPQFGPFTNVPPGSSRDASTLAGPSALYAQPGGPSGSGPLTGALPLLRGSGASGPEFYAHQESYATSQYPRSGTLSQLSGPGIPGPSSAILQHSALPSESRGALPLPEAQRGMSAFPGSSPVQLFPPPSPFSHGAGDPSRALSASAGGSHRFSDEPRMPQRVTLPPILVDPRQDVLGPSPTSRYPPLLHPIDPATPTSSTVGLRRVSYGQEAESPFAHLPPLNIPPPFTLEPRPQWDDPAFSPFSRPGSSSRPPSSYALPPSMHFPLPPVEAMTTRPSETLPPILPRRSEDVDDSHRLSTPLHLRTRADYSRVREHPSRSVTPRAGTSSRHSDETARPSR